MGRVQSIDRAFAIMDVISASDLGITELAERVGMPKSTVARLVKTLVELGAVERISPGATYRIGPRLSGLSTGRSRAVELAARARPHLKMLADGLGEDAGLAIPDGNRVHYIAQEDALNNVVVRDWTGTLLPMHVVPSGLVILAHWPPDQLDSYIAAKPESYTRYTVTDPRLIRKRLKSIRTQRYAWVMDEFVEGISSVASPVYDGQMRVLGAIHVHGPSYRFPGSADRDAIAASVAEAAERVSIALQ
ncbi:MAG: IclR family transcriptional regulator [bacterium]|nr:IclR family transcriptional regulator [bacterium]